MASELNMLAHRLNRISESHRSSRDFTLGSLRRALRETIAAFPVYRTYLGDDEGNEAGGGGKAPSPAANERDQENIARAIAEAEMLQIVVFSVLFGVALAMLPDDKRRPMLAFTESLAETMFRFTKIVMLMAPIGVGAAIAYTVGQLGVGILVNLFQLLATFYVAVAIFVVVVLLPVAMIAKVPIRRFAQAVAEPVSIAFATTSSEAALPRAMEAMERFGVPRQIVAFVMPTGYSFNLDGSTLYLSLAAIFVAQAAGIELSVGQQFVLLLTLMLSSKGVAGVPRGAIVILLGTVTSFGLPAEPVFVILGIDAVLDMLRTSLNVLGNCLATVVIARWEGEFPGNESTPNSQFPTPNVQT
jgi:proton glutamate symport protein